MQPAPEVTAAIMAPGHWGRGLPCGCTRECEGLVLQLSCCHLITGPLHGRSRGHAAATHRSRAMEGLGGGQGWQH